MNHNHTPMPDAGTQTTPAGSTGTLGPLCLVRSPMVFGWLTLCICICVPTWNLPNRAVAQETPSGKSPSDDAELVLYICDPMQMKIQCGDNRHTNRNFDLLLDQLNLTLNVKLRFEHVDLDAVEETIAQSILSPSFAGCIVPRESLSQDTKTSVNEIARLDSEEFFDGQRIVFVVPKQDPAQTILDIDGYQIQIANPTRTHQQLITEIFERLKIDRTELKNLAEPWDWQIVSGGKSVAFALLEAEWAFLQKCENSPVKNWKMIGQTEELGPLVFFEPKDRDAESRRQLVSAITLIKNEETLAALKSNSGFLKTDDESVLERLRAEFDQ